MGVITDHIAIQPGREWTAIQNTTFSFDIQNTLDVRLEYSFINDSTISRALFLNISDFIRSVQQTIYVRAYDLDQHGTVAVIRYDEDLDFSSASRPIVNANINHNRLGLDAWGKNKVSNDYSLLHGMATFDISPKVWYVDEDGIELPLANYSTRVISKSGGFQITSGAVNGNSSVLRSRLHPRYQPNRGWLFSTAGILPNKTALSKRVFGALTDESGFFFELNNGVLYSVVRHATWEYFTATASQTQFVYGEEPILPTSTVNVRSLLDGEVVWIEQTEFTVDTNTATITFTTGRTLNELVIIQVINDMKEDLTSELTLHNIDIEKQALYDIQAQWRGAGDVFFIINQIQVHQYKSLQVNTTPVISNPALPIFYGCYNQGDEAGLLMGCADITSEGGKADKKEYTALLNKPWLPVLATDIDADPKVLLIAYSPRFYHGRHNSRDFTTLRVSASVEKNTFLQVYRSRNPIFSSGTLVLKDRHDGSSILYDDMIDDATGLLRTTPLALDITSAELVAAKRVSAGQSGSISNPNEDQINYNLSHGDYLILTASYEKQGVTSEVIGSIELGEEL